MNPRILIVEDDPAVRSALILALRHAVTDANIKVVDTLLAAKRALIAEDFDLVTLDLNLPDSKGIRTVDDFEEALEASSAQVVVVSGIEEDVKEALSLRSIPSFGKPFNLKPLVDVVRTMLAKPKADRKTIAQAKRDLDEAICEFATWLHVEG